MSPPLFYPRKLRSVPCGKIKINNTKRYLTNDYKLLLLMYFIWGLPFAPCELEGWSDTARRILTVTSLLFNICRVTVSLFSIYYTGYMLPKPSLILTYNTFIVSCILVNACLFVKRRKILEVAKLVISVMDQVSPRNFKSRWSVPYFIFLNISGVIMVSATVTLVDIKMFASANMTSPMPFLWYEVNDVQLLKSVLAFISSFAFISCGGAGTVCGLFVITVYFHLGDIISNFGNKLLKRFEYYHGVDQHSLIENLNMLQNIKDLSVVVNDTFSTAMLLIYAALLAGFFLGVGMMRSFQNSEPEQAGLVLSIFICSLFYFICITKAGDRVIRKELELKEHVIGHSVKALVQQNGLDIPKMSGFSILASEMRSADFAVTGGNMFVICDSLMLTVTGTLITYGVLISQID